MSLDHTADSNLECAMTVDDARLLVHDLRAPMTAIIGYAGMLRRADSQKDRDHIVEALERAVARMDDMLEAAASGRFMPHAVSAAADSVDLCALVREATTDLLASWDIEMTVECDEGTVVPGDALLLRRALDNMLANAVRYGEAGPIEVHVEVAGQDVAISVSDRGPGIPEEDRERVLQPLERLERDRDTPGAGLGLGVVANVAQAHGGRAKVLGRDGGGTTVRIELPART